MKSQWTWDKDLICWVAFIGGVMVLSDDNVTKLDRYNWQKKIVPPSEGKAYFVTIQSTTGEYLTRVIWGLQVGDPDMIYRRDISGDQDDIYDARFKNLILVKPGQKVPTGALRPNCARKV